MHNFGGFYVVHRHLRILFKSNVLHLCFEEQSRLTDTVGFGFGVCRLEVFEELRTEILGGRTIEEVDRDREEATTDGVFNPWATPMGQAMAREVSGS